ncbi:MAG TPA: hypothetical protein VMU17_06215 [Elusimicrobiota bacterium]|nr:hypothetical protein [Elusimicrobiota bacterium]
MWLRETSTVQEAFEKVTDIEHVFQVFGLEASCHDRGTLAAIANHAKLPVQLLLQALNNNLSCWFPPSN